MNKIKIPLTVPVSKHRDYVKNWNIATAGSGSLLLFAGDQKVEHQNDDFFGSNIALEDASPEHLFQIASAAPIGVFATHLGFIANYGASYPKVPYLVKLNGKTNLDKHTEDLVSKAWLEIEDIIEFKKQNNLNIIGVGYTVYLGGANESEMLKEAAQIVNKAHKNGLLAIIWMYPRGKNINEDNIHTIAGGAGVAAALGADFVKVKYPYDKKVKATAENFREVIKAAGRTNVICVGGSKQEAKELLSYAWHQKNIAGANGLALGRNLHQRPLVEAIKLATALALIINHDTSLEDALAVYSGKKKIESHRKSDFLGLF
jgi:fructose-bisphosphate aldolase/6-deoxy-5-ketofructose 1-phosphate synthase